MAGWMIFLYIALLLTIIVINVWVFYRNMRPLYVLLHWLDKYRIGKGNEPLQNNTRVSEFRKLNEAAVRYAERSEQMFEQQKQFIGNASHEMQTPLAICRNRLEMLMEDENLSESQLEELMKNPSDFGAYNEAEQVFVIAFEDRERSIYGYYPSRSE